VEREGFGAANPEGGTKESLANFDESSLSREEESLFLCRTFPWKGKGSAQPIPKGSQKKALPISMKVHFQEKRRVLFFVKVVLIIMSS
jgi:hypothetical protein